LLREDDLSYHLPGICFGNTSAHRDLKQPADTVFVTSVRTAQIFSTLRAELVDFFVPIADAKDCDVTAAGAS
jgi:hypothetical protein